MCALLPKLLQEPVVHVLEVELHVVPVVHCDRDSFLRHLVIPKRRQVEDVLKGGRGTVRATDGTVNAGELFFLLEKCTSISVK